MTLIAFFFFSDPGSKQSCLPGICWNHTFPNFHVLCEGSSKTISRRYLEPQVPSFVHPSLALKHVYNPWSTYINGFQICFYMDSCWLFLSFNHPIKIPPWSESSKRYLEPPQVFPNMLLTSHFPTSQIVRRMVLPATKAQPFSTAPNLPTCPEEPPIVLAFLICFSVFPAFLISVSQFLRFLEHVSALIQLLQHPVFPFPACFPFVHLFFQQVSACFPWLPRIFQLVSQHFPRMSLIFPGFSHGFPGFSPGFPHGPWVPPGQRPAGDGGAQLGAGRELSGAGGRQCGARLQWTWTFRRGTGDGDLWGAMGFYMVSMSYWSFLWCFYEWYFVGGLVVCHEFYIFPSFGEFLIIPIDFHIFQRGGWTTNQVIMYQINIWGFPEMGVPPNGWFIMENTSMNGWFGGTHGYPISGNLYIIIYRIIYHHPS